MIKHYIEPQTKVIDFLPEAVVCTTSNRPGSSSDYDEDDENDIFDD